MPQTPSAAPTPASPLEQTAPQGLAVTNTDVIVPAQLAATQAGDATPPPALDQTLRGAAGGPVGAPPKIGRFSVLRVLGEGGMGVVYAAYDEDLDRKVAIKVLRDSMHGGAQGRPRILREAQAMARLSHPNVVQVYDVGEHDGLIFVAMEFVKGRTLTRWLDERERPWQEVRDMFVQAGRGLAAAHAEGIVHRDFKPDNVLVGLDERARVADFGLAGAAIARAAGEGAASSDVRPVASADPSPEATATGLRRSAFDAAITVRGMIMGTPAFMSPEQHAGASTDARTDQFSFCVALWGALYQDPPFYGETLVALTAAVTLGKLREPPPGREVPPWLHAALVTGLANVPERRHPSMAAVLAALTRDLATPPPRSRWRGVAAVLGGATLAAALTVALLTREREPTSEELAQIARLAAEARAASADAHWVYPPPEAPGDTAILRLVELERMEGSAAAPARATAGTLREEFAEALVALGDDYWARDSGRAFARDYYAQALVFRPDHPRARERGLLTPGQLAELEDKARSGTFTPTDIVAAEPLAILAEKDSGVRNDRLAALQARPGRDSTLQKLLLAALIDDDAPPPEEEIAAAPPRFPELAPPRLPELARPALGLPVDVPPDEPPGEPNPVSEPTPVAEPRAPVEPKAATPRPPEPPRAPRPRDAPPGPPVAPGADDAADAADTDDADDEAISRAAEDRALSDALTAQGEAARRSGDLDGAQLLFNQALAANSRNGAALMGLSNLEFDRGRFEQAVVFAERAVKKQPKNQEFRIGLGDAYFKVLRLPDARAQYERAATLGHPRAAARLEKVKERLGD